jgi:hypothetical protein
MSNRTELLRAIKDPSSTSSEVEAAQREINTATGKTVSRNLLDDELESYLSPNPNLRSSDLVATRQQFSQATQTILNDLGAALLTLPPAEGAADRLTDLLAKTNSPVVRERATQALKTLSWMQPAPL